MKKEFLEHLQDCGIVLRLSCPGTPEKNGITERKHKHSVELGLAMMYQARTLKCFWVDAFSTAIFLLIACPHHY